MGYELWFMGYELCVMDRLATKSQYGLWDMCLRFLLLLVFKYGLRVMGFPLPIFRKNTGCYCKCSVINALLLLVID